MTEAFERTASLGSLLLCVVLRWSSGPLLPGTREEAASFTWAEYVPGCFRFKGTLHRKALARGIAVGVASLSGSYSYRLMAALTICDCFSAEKLASLKNTCTFIKGFTCPTTASKRLDKMLNLVSYSNPFSPEHFNRLKVCPQVIQRILSTTRCFPSPANHLSNRAHVLPVSPEVCQPFSLVPLVYQTQRD